MLAIYKTTEQGLEQLDTMTNGVWVKAIDPTPEEIGQLVNWGVDVDYINYSLDLDEMPRMERDEDYTFILIRIPHRQPESVQTFLLQPSLLERLSGSLCDAVTERRAGTTSGTRISGSSRKMRR